MNPGNKDEDPWESSLDLFGRLIESDDPEATLAAEPNPAIRAAAERLWRHHVSAEEEKFLDRGVDFTVAPIFRPGQMLLDRFEVQRLLGQGGMGEVYLAYDHTLGETVALKTIARLIASSRGIRRRFVAEVQNARRITHLNVCRIHELFDQEEAVFFAMEYVEGRPLNEVIAAAALSSNEAREITLQLAEGLDAAHRNGVVHGDFKPSNVLIAAGSPPRAVIMDFGLARALRGEAGDDSTETLGAGTRDYMAPELLAGAPPTIASDVFAFGKVARQLLPGEKIWDLCSREHPGERLASLAPVIQRLRRDNTRRYWVGGAVLAAASAPLYSILRSKAPARIEAGARILVNGFQALESALAQARLARSLLVTALQQSPQFRTIGDQDLLPAVRRLSPGSSLPMPGDVLQGILSQQRASHWIDGLLRQANGRVSLDLRVWRTADRSLHAESTFADLPAVTALAQQTAVWIRKLAGESERSLEANPAAVGTYTSRIPEALQNYYQAMEYYSLAQMKLAEPLLKEAVRLDPQFAQAMSVLGMCWNSQRKHVEAMDAVEHACQLAAGLPQRERAWIEAFYHELARDPDKMLESSRLNMEFNPDEPRYYRIYGQNLCLAGSAVESIPFFEKAVDLAPQNTLLRNELALALTEGGHFGEALAVAEEAQAHDHNPQLNHGYGVALLGLGRYAEAYSAFEPVPQDGRILQASARIMAGETDSAIVLLRQELATLRDGDNPTAQHRAREFLCGTYFLTDRVDLAVAQLRDMVPMPECPMTAQRLQASAFWAARIGDDAVLSSAAGQLQRIASRWENKYTRAVALHARALEEWRRHEVPAAERDLIDSVGSAFSIWALFDLADFFADTGRPALAEEYWRKLEARHGVILRRWCPGAILYGWLQRGIAAQMRGDRVVASECGEKILRHWSRSHPQIRLVERAATLR